MIDKTFQGGEAGRSRLTQVICEYVVIRVICNKALIRRDSAVIHRLIDVIIKISKQDNFFIRKMCFQVLEQIFGIIYTPIVVLTDRTRFSMDYDESDALHD